MELPKAEREAYLRRECGTEEGLLATLLAMVQHAEQEETGFSQDIGRLATELSDLRDRSGEQVGRYRLQERIRVGGMAEVYRAVRADGEFTQDVALKIVRRDRVPESMAPLFQRERELLARLRHPHISQIFDGGTTDAGEPYFVMERIEGQAFLDACRAPDLDWRTALGLFLDLGSAVSYAHRQLVVHRDIKSENVLVERGAGGARTVKLVDFGIAAAMTTSDETEEKARDAWFSPTSAAPEILAGETGGVAADVFSLGALLDRLAENFPPRYQEEIRCIARHAMEDDPAARYESAEAVAADVRRVRDREPISLLADRRGYAFRRFLERHVLAVSVAAALVLAGAFAIAREVSLRRSAEAATRVAQAERDKAESMRDFLVEAYEAADPTLNDGKDLKVYELLDRQLLALEGDRSLAPEVRVDLLGTLGGAFLHLGRLETADRALRRALEELGPLQGESSPSGSLRWAWLKIALAQSARVAERFDEAEALLQEVERQRASWIEAEDSAETEQNFHSTYAALGQVRGQLPEAEQHIREALEIQQRRGGEDQDRTDLLVTLGSIQSARGDLRAALHSFEQAYALEQAEPERASPERLATLGWLGITHDKLGEPGPAETYLKAAIPLAERLYPLGNRKVSSAYNNLGTMYLTNGRLTEAEPLLRKALAILEGLGDTSSTLYQSRLNNLGRLAAEREDIATATPLFEAALRANLERSDAPRIAKGYSSLGSLALTQVRYEAGLAHANRALEFLRRSKNPADALLPLVLLQAAHGQAGLRHAAAAEAHLREADEAMVADHSENDRELVLVAHQKGEVLRLLGRQKEALAAFREALDAYGRLGALGHPSRARCLLRSAELEADLGDLAAARKDLGEAQPILDRELVAGSPSRRRLAALAARLAI